MCKSCYKKPIYIVLVSQRLVVECKHKQAFTRSDKPTSFRKLARSLGCTLDTGNPIFTTPYYYFTFIFT